MPHPARTELATSQAPAPTALIGLRNALLLSLPIWLAVAVVLGLL